MTARSRTQDFRRSPLRLAVPLTAVVVAMLFVGGDWMAPRTEAGSGWPFTRGTLNLEIMTPTSLAFGPDGRLYVASLTEIRALTLSAAGTSVVSSEPVATGLTGTLGIAFEPNAQGALTLYASGQDADAPEGYQGIVSSFTAPNWSRVDIITGLPTSAPRLNHLTNGITFDNQGRLLIAQGSSTDSGIADPPGMAEYFHETPLSAAILVADIHAPDFDGAVTHSGPPINDNVNLTGGDVRVLASGTRNPYDLVAHSNGLLYATDNGPLGLGTSIDCTTAGGRTSTADELNLIEDGNYYGAPNRNRGRTDPRQCVYRSPLDGDGPDFTAPIAVLPGHCSCDGMLEYNSDAFDSELQGGLVIAQFIRNSVVIALLSPDGRQSDGVISLADGFDNPLDVTATDNGTIYVAEFGANAVSYLVPDESAFTPLPSPTSTLTPLPTTPGGPTATRTPTRTPTPQGDAGDVDCNGTINSIDAALILQMVASLIQIFPCGGNPDADDDGAVTSIDAALVLQYTAGLIEQLPP